MKKPKYKVFKRTNGYSYQGIEIEDTFKEAINWCSDRIFHGNDLINFEIRPVDSRVLDDAYLKDCRDSAYLVRENGKPVLKCFRFSAQGWYEMTAHEIDEWDNKEEKNEPVFTGLEEDLINLWTKEKNPLNTGESGPEINNKNKPEQVVFLFSQSDLLDLLIMLNFIQPSSNATRKFFKPGLINDLKEQIADHINEEI